MPWRAEMQVVVEGVQTRWIEDERVWESRQQVWRRKEEEVLQ
tara:strand:+ start:181 stop:306 length:126 start_codon:yes stop_codon:yes gene_type:complete